MHQSQITIPKSAEYWNWLTSIKEAHLQEKSVFLWPHSCNRRQMDPGPHWRTTYSTDCSANVWLVPPVSAQSRYSIHHFQQLNLYFTVHLCTVRLFLLSLSRCQRVEARFDRKWSLDIWDALTDIFQCQVHSFHLWSGKLQHIVMRGLNSQALLKKAQKRLFFLQQLKKFSLGLV